MTKMQSYRNYINYLLIVLVFSIIFSLVFFILQSVLAYIVYYQYEQSDPNWLATNCTVSNLTITNNIETTLCPRIHHNPLKCLYDDVYIDKKLSIYVTYYYESNYMVRSTIFDTIFETCNLCKMSQSNFGDWCIGNCTNHNTELAYYKYSPGNIIQCVYRQNEPALAKLNLPDKSNSFKPFAIYLGFVLITSALYILFTAVCIVYTLKSKNQRETYVEI